MGAAHTTTVHLAGIQCTMSHNAANVLLVKGLLVLVVFCLAECAAGAKPPKSSCLKYGHSCWGGHGKRNGAGLNNGVIRLRDEAPAHVANTRWYLSRLVQAPADLRLWRDERDNHNMVTRNSQDRRIQNDSEIDTDFVKRPVDEAEEVNTDSQPEDTDEDIVVLEEPQSTFGQKLRLYKLMKKNSDKLK